MVGMVALSDCISAVTHYTTWADSTRDTEMPMSWPAEMRGKALGPVFYDALMERAAWSLVYWMDLELSDGQRPARSRWFLVPSKMPMSERQC